MAKPYISKQKVRDFVSRVSLDKTDAIEKEYEALLTKEIKSLDAFKRLEEALSEARKAAREIKQAGYGDSVLASIPTSDFLIDRMISRGKSFYNEPPKAWASICELLNPFVERLAKVRNARQSAYRIIDEAQTGRAAADALREAGLDYYTWEARKPEMVLDLTALKGGD
jgi:cell division septum initiation protein DivIVA